MLPEEELSNEAYVSIHHFHSLMFPSFLALQIVITLEIYGVKNIVGIPFGYRGFTDKGLGEMPVSSYFLTRICIFHSIFPFFVRLFYSYVCLCPLNSWFSNIQLTRKVVQNIHLSGGSLLGVSRGGPSIREIVDTMEVLRLYF